MSVRLKLALTVFAAGLVTALLVMASMVVAFQRFEHETAFRRGSAFLQRVASGYDNLYEIYERRPDEFQGWLRNLVLYEPEIKLYLLDARGEVLSCSGEPLQAGTRVAMTPVLQALGNQRAPYVMGDDPERRDASAVIAVQPIRRTVIRSGEPVAGYLYLVMRTEQLPSGRLEVLRASLARPALWTILAVIAATTLLAVAIIASVTRPLQRLSDAVASVTQGGLDAGLPASAALAVRGHARSDEFGQLGRAFEMMLGTLRRQWAALRRLDHFRREGVSNLSHDLRSPLTATVTCLETLEARCAAGAPGAFGGSGSSADDAAESRRLIAMALRNARNAARLVQSLGDLAQLDEPAFQLHPERVDVSEWLGDVALRFAERALRQGVALEVEPPADGAALPVAPIDVELFERAVANLIDNALGHCPAGGRIGLAAERVGAEVRVRVADTGAGIDPADLPHLFDRYYRSRHDVAPASADGGRGLGLAIVKRIVELHGGTATVESRLGAGTTVTLTVPTATA